MVNHPPGHLAPPSFTGCSAANLHHATTLASGARWLFHKHEAAALVAANAGAYS